MSCLDTQTFLGTRGYCTPDTSYTLYLEDLNGLSNTAFSKISGTSGYDLVNLAIREGIRKLVNDIALTHTNTLVDVYHQSEFTNTINTIPTVPTERGIKVSMYNAQHYQLSTLQLRTVYIKVNTPLVDVALNIYADGVLVYSDVVSTVNNQLTYFPTQEVKGRSIEVTFEQNGVETYQAYINTNNCNCKKPLYTKSCGLSYLTKDKLFVEGGFGINVDIDLLCDADKIACSLLPYFMYEARLAAGIYIAQEVMVTDRLNFFTTNNKEDIAEMARGWNNEYWEGIKSKLARVSYAIKCIDSNCFSCNSVKQTIQLV